MKKIVIGTLVGLFSVNGFTETNSYLMNAKTLRFAAPVVSGTPSTTDNPVGSIIYDVVNNNFKGLFAGGWGDITQGASITPPQVTVYKTGTAQTYTPPAGALYLRVRMVGGGGGGSGGRAPTGNPSGVGGDGGNTTFSETGGSLSLVAYKGLGGPVVPTTFKGGAGGATDLDGLTGIEVPGAYGAAGSVSNSTYGARSPGAMGGGSPFGGAGMGASYSSDSNTNAIANTGSGGGGGNANSPGVDLYSGNGGGAGGYIDVIITSPAPQYTYTVGTGGTAGTAGNDGYPGGAGAAGIIEVTAYFQ
jgi:hypothetical protein